MKRKGTEIEIMLLDQKKKIDIALVV